MRSLFIHPLGCAATITSGNSSLRTSLAGSHSGWTFLPQWTIIGRSMAPEEATVITKVADALLEFVYLWLCEAPLRLMTFSFPLKKKYRLSFEFRKNSKMMMINTLHSRTKKNARFELIYFKKCSMPITVL